MLKSFIRNFNCYKIFPALFLTAAVLILLILFLPLKSLILKAGFDINEDFIQNFLKNLNFRVILLSVCFAGSTVITYIYNRFYQNIPVSKINKKSKKKPLPDIYKLIFTAILAFGVLYRLSFLNMPLRYDEAYSYQEFVNKNIFYVLTYYPLPNNHIFYNFLVWFLAGVFSISEIIIRLPALIAGIAILPLTFFLVKKTAGVFCAFSALLIVSFHPSLVFYSVNGRGYSIITLASLATLYLICTGKKDNKYFPARIIINSLALWTVPSYSYIFLSTSIYCICSEVKNKNKSGIIREIGIIIYTVIFTGALYSPVVLISGANSLTADNFREFNQAFFSSLLNQINELANYIFTTPENTLSFSAALIAVIGLIFTLKKYQLSRTISVIIIFSICFTFFIGKFPYKRIFLFLIPLAAIEFAFFCSVITENLKKNHLFRFVRLIPFVLIASWCIWNLKVQNSKIRYNKETSMVNSAPAVAESLKFNKSFNELIVPWIMRPSIEFYTEENKINTIVKSYPIKAYINKNALYLENKKYKKQIPQWFSKYNNKMPVLSTEKINLYQIK